MLNLKNMFLMVSSPVLQDGQEGSEKDAGRRETPRAP